MKTILFLPIFIIFSCKSSFKSANNEDFPSGKYKVETVSNEKFKALKEYTINLNAEENRIGGTFDCNTFSCDFEKNEGTIKFGYAVATKMYCEGKMHNESAFFVTLREITNYSYKKGKLKLFNAEGDQLLELNLSDSE